MGEDIPELLGKHNQLRVHFSEWKNFEEFLTKCSALGVSKLYITGQNTDSLLYAYLEELIDYLQGRGFTVGLRTNGYLAEKQLAVLNKCDNNVGYSIHSFNPEVVHKMIGRKSIPNWDAIIPATKNVRVSIVVNRYNAHEFWDVLNQISQYPNVKYIQVRRVSTDTRFEQLKEDVALYEALFSQVEKDPRATYLGKFYTAEQFEIFGKEVNFWRTVETSVNSLNYFTDGTLSENYFVVEGYLQNYQKP